MDSLWTDPSAPPGTRSLSTTVTEDGYLDDEEEDMSYGPLITTTIDAI